MARVKGEAGEVRETAEQIKNTLQELVHMDKAMADMAKRLDNYVKDGGADELKDIADQVGRQLCISMEPCFTVYQKLRAYADFLDSI